MSWSLCQQEQTKAFFWPTCLRFRRTKADSTRNIFYRSRPDLLTSVLLLATTSTSTSVKRKSRRFDSLGGPIFSWSEMFVPGRCCPLVVADKLGVGSWLCTYNIYVIIGCLFYLISKYLFTRLPAAWTPKHHHPYSIDGHLHEYVCQALFTENLCAFTTSNAYNSDWAVTNSKFKLSDRGSAVMQDGDARAYQTPASERLPSTKLAQRAFKHVY